ncbi:MAG: homoserine dehydrogenase [Rhodobacteraceae bacterium]|nr:homoserine dehydrogenase [Paracoccaceae bacterium]
MPPSSGYVTPTGLAKDLARRAEAGNPVRVGLIGAGEMGTDVAVRIGMMAGIELAAIVERTPQKAHDAMALAHAGNGQCRTIADSGQLNAEIEAGRTGITESIEPLLDSGLIDVVIDATGVPAVGAEAGLAVMEHGKHLVMMNVEADVTIGPILKREADRLGVVYSLGAGDEPSSCMELIEFASAMGHRIVCAGKGKNNPLNFDAVPEDYEREARLRNMNPRMLVEFVDGSKTMVEMAAIANATGLVPDCDGMHGPAAGRDELAKTLIPKRDGGILSDSGRVDFSVGKGIAPGVFVIIEAEHPRILERLRDLKVGEGPFFAFIRPYHLTSLEVPLTCARAVLYGTADMAPLNRPTAQVCALAKRDLPNGITLGQIGEADYRAWVIEADRSHALGAIPAGILADSKTSRPIRKGELITAQNVQLPDAAVVRLRRRQDQMIYGADGANF